MPDDATMTRMRETPEDEAVRGRVFSVAAGELRQFVERYERLEEEVLAEARSRGYDAKVLRKLIALRKRDPDEVREEEAILALYKQAIGM